MKAKQFTALDVIYHALAHSPQDDVLAQARAVLEALRTNTGVLERCAAFYAADLFDDDPDAHDRQIATRWVAYVLDEEIR